MHRLLLVVFGVLVTSLAPLQVGAISQADEHALLYGSTFYDENSCTTTTDPGDDDSSGGGSSIKAPEPYASIFADAANHYHIQPALLAALFYAGEHASSWPKPPTPYGNGGAWATNSSSGAAGPFQFLPSTWDAFGVDGNGDGNKEIQDLKDASYGAANYASSGNGGGQLSMGSSDTAIKQFFYNYGGSSSEYANRVFSAYQRFLTNQDNPNTSPADELSSSGDGGGTSSNCANTFDGSNSCMTLKSPSITDGNALADAIDSYIKKNAPSSPMLNTGKYFVQGAQESGVNPIFMVAIARKEANFLTDPNATDMINGNNPFAYSQFGNWPASGRWAKFPDIPTAIVEVMKQMKTGYLEGGVNGGDPLVTIPEVLNKYAPTSENNTAAYINQMKTWISELSSQAGSAVSCGVSGAPDIIKHNPTLGDSSTIHPTAIILHEWDFNGGDRGIEALYDALDRQNLSVQFGILHDGKTYQLTQKANSRAAHAFCANSYAIGIELEGTGAEMNDSQATKRYSEQFQATVKLVKYLMDKYNIPLNGTVKNPASNGGTGVLRHKEVNDKCPPHNTQEPRSDLEKPFFDDVVNALGG